MADTEYYDDEQTEYDPWDPNDYGTYVFHAYEYSKKTDKLLNYYYIEDSGGEMYYAEAEGSAEYFENKINQELPKNKYCKVIFYMV